MQIAGLQHLPEKFLQVSDELPASLPVLCVIDQRGKVAVNAKVARVVEDVAVGLLPVPARAPNLLVVRRDVAGSTVVYHVPNVRLVDAHAERNRGDDDLELVREERLVDGTAVRHGAPGVVKVALDAEAEENFRDLLRRRLRRAVDDRSATWGGGQDRHEVCLYSRAWSKQKGRDVGRAGG